MSADEATGTIGQKTDLSTKCLGAAAIGLGGGLIGLFMGLANGDKNPFLGWLWGTAFWLSIAIGMLMLVMLFRVFNSQWTPVVRRQMEHCLAAFPWLGACFLPLLLVVWFGATKQASCGIGSILPATYPSQVKCTKSLTTCCFRKKVAI